MLVIPDLVPGTLKKVQDQADIDGSLPRGCYVQQPSATGGLQQPPQLWWNSKGTAQYKADPVYPRISVCNCPSVDKTDSSSSGMPVGALAGGIGAVFVLVLAILLIRRRNRSSCFTRGQKSPRSSKSTNAVILSENIELGAINPTASRLVLGSGNGSDDSGCSDTAIDASYAQLTSADNIKAGPVLYAMPHSQEASATLRRPTVDMVGGTIVKARTMSSEVDYEQHDGAMGDLNGPDSSDIPDPYDEVRTVLDTIPRTLVCRTQLRVHPVRRYPSFSAPVIGGVRTSETVRIKQQQQIANDIWAELDQSSLLAVQHPGQSGTTGWVVVVCQGKTVMQEATNDTGSTAAPHNSLAGYEMPAVIFDNQYEAGMSTSSTTEGHDHGITHMLDNAYEALMQEPAPGKGKPHARLLDEVYDGVGDPAYDDMLESGNDADGRHNSYGRLVRGTTNTTTAAGSQVNLGYGRLGARGPGAEAHVGDIAYGRLRSESSNTNNPTAVPEYNKLQREARENYDAVSDALYDAVAHEYADTDGSNLYDQQLPLQSTAGEYDKQISVHDRVVYDDHLPSLDVVSQDEKALVDQNALYDLQLPPTLGTPAHKNPFLPNDNTGEQQYSEPLDAVTATYSEPQDKRRVRPDSGSYAEPQRATNKGHDMYTQPQDSMVDRPEEPVSSSHAKSDRTATSSAKPSVVYSTLPVQRGNSFSEVSQSPPVTYAIVKPGLRAKVSSAQYAAAEPFEEEPLGFTDTLYDSHDDAAERRRKEESWSTYSEVLKPNSRYRKPHGRQ